VEINSASFTKLLQTHTYNILHTSAAYRETFVYERLDSLNASYARASSADANVTIVLQESEQLTCQSMALFYVSHFDLLIVGPSNTHTN